LPPRNGLTVAAAWQKGVVEPPTAGQLLRYWLEDNRGLVAAMFGLALMLAYYAFAWLSVGRDPPIGTIIPLFAPPDGMSPAATRYVDRMSFDNGCFTAAIINLGVKGHLQIVEHGSGTTLKKRAGGKPLAPEEQTLMTRLFGTKKSVLLDNVNHVVIGGAKEGLDGALSQTYIGKLFANNFGWSGFGLFLGVLVVAAVLLAAASANQALLWLLVMISVFGVLPVMIGASMTYIGWQRVARGKGLLIAGVAVTALVIVGVMIATWMAQPGVANLALAGALLAVGAIAAVGFPWLKAPSRSGRKTMDQIEGFREYLSVAEEDRLNVLNPPHKTPELFERFLPYAVALDCQNAWAAKFAGVLAAAGTAAAAATAWYVGSRDWSSDPVSFADHLGSDLSSTISSSATAPGSSSGSGGGGGGGGSSGGGGGGGGGGGW
jgi:uncharacterized membrane protein YgcG